MEGATILYKAERSDSHRKILYTHLSDNKKQDGSTFRCNTGHVLNDLDERGELPRESLESIYKIVDGCAVQYYCSQILYFLSQIALSWSVRFAQFVQVPDMVKKKWMVYRVWRKHMQIQYLLDPVNWLKCLMMRMQI